MADNVDNTLLQKLLQDIRKEQTSHTRLLKDLFDAHTRLERRLDNWTKAADLQTASATERIARMDARISGLKEDLELMLTVKPNSVTHSLISRHGLNT